MSIVSAAERVVRAIEPDDDQLWFEGAGRYPPRCVLRITAPEAIAMDGNLRPGASYELVLVLERGAFGSRVMRGRFGTAARGFPIGSYIDSIATIASISEREA